MTDHAASPLRFDVTIVGDANQDLLLYGLPEDLPAEQELLADVMALRLGGSGAITAHNLAALGNSVGFITSLADDDLGNLCRNELASAQVDLSRCVQPVSAQTGITALLHIRSAATCSPMPERPSASPRPLSISTTWLALAIST